MTAAPSEAAERERAEGLGWVSGAGLVIANMVGAGVLLSTGFMAQELGPASILIAWLLGAVLALLGAVAYCAIAVTSGRSGGEYRYLSDHLSPFLGYLSGWGSLVLGFSAPIAVDALAVASFLRVIVAELPETPTAVAAVALVTLAHAFHVQSSRGTQNLLVALKIGLLLALVAIGVFLGSNAWPSWSPPDPPGDGFFTAFLLQQYWIAFAFSGWNAAVYVAGEFRRPRIDVPRAVFTGCALVAVLYLVLNWIFVANLDPELARVVFDYDAERVTLAHALLEKLVGPSGATIAAAIIAMIFLSAMSAMIFVGPRVYAEMAEDGFLPEFLRMRSGRLPTASVLLQGALAIVFVLTHDILAAVQSASFVLMLFSGLTCLTVFRLRASGAVPRPGVGALVAAGIYAATMAFLLVLGLTRFGHVGIEMAAVLALATIFYVRAKRR